MAASVVCSRIEEINPLLQSIMKSVYGSLIVHVAPSGLMPLKGPWPTNGPTAQPEGADFNAALA
jgi:hypothetical protein